MSTQTGRPLRADARRNRARILEVAHEVFADQGMTAAIDEIAELAGVGVGTIYRHFPTKEALFQAIVAHRIESITEEILVLAEAEDPGEAFFTMFHRLVTSTKAGRDFVEAMTTSAGADLSTVSAQCGDSMLEAIGLVLTRAQRAGAVRTDLTAADVQGLMVGAHAIQQHSAGGQRALTTALKVICDGLRPNTDANN
jgi:AcrR family transcriptional regulator